MIKTAIGTFVGALGAAAVVWTIAAQQELLPNPFVYPAPNFESYCSVNALGIGSCTFHNVGTVTGTKCVKVKLTRSGDVIESSPVCSGLVAAKDIKDRAFSGLSRPGEPGERGERVDASEICGNGLRYCAMDIEEFRDSKQNVERSAPHPAESGQAQPQSYDADQQRELAERLRGAAPNSIERDQQQGYGKGETSEMNRLILQTNK